MNKQISRFPDLLRAALLLPAVVVCALTVRGATPPLTTLHAIHALTNAEARQGIPVDFEATVGYSRGY